MVQMFVVSNEYETKYYAAAQDDELNPKFISGWVDTKNKMVNGYLDFARTVLKIPMAHKMVSQYSIIDNDKTSVTYTYTSKYGLYAGKTIELNDGSKILLGNDMYWFYLSGNTKRVLCDDYRAYKKVPNNPNDSYWSYYWSQLN